MPSTFEGGAEIVASHPMGVIDELPELLSRASAAFGVARRLCEPSRNALRIAAFIVHASHGVERCSASRCTNSRCSSVR